MASRIIWLVLLLLVADLREFKFRMDRSFMLVLFVRALLFMLACPMDPPTVYVRPAIRPTPIVLL